jgi:hypothetical protein
VAKVIGVKLTDQDLMRFSAAAKLANAKTVASWLRVLGRRATTPKAKRKIGPLSSVVVR